MPWRPFIHLSEDLLLEDFKAYKFITSGAMPINDVDDAAMLRETTEAMTVMGMTPEEQEAVFRCVSGVLLMGSMQFKTERNTDQAVLPDNTGGHYVGHAGELGLLLRSLPVNKSHG